MKDMKKIALFMLIGCVAAVVLALAGCGSFKGFQVSGCSGSKCATATVQPVGKSSPPHTAAPVTTATPTVPLSSPTYDPSQAVLTCLGPDPTKDDLEALAVQGSDAQQNLIVCLHIPVDFRDQFISQLTQLAAQYQNQGRFDYHHGRSTFTGQDLPQVAQRCHSGQES